MNTPVYFVSDNHFHFNHKYNELKRREKLFQLFTEIKKTSGTLIIGGDFLDFWYDYGSNYIQGYDDIFEALSDLNNSGIKIHYILGNHDFWDFGYFTSKFGAIVHSKNLIFDLNGEKIKVIHGDGLLKNDNGYRFMKKIIRHPISIFLFGLLGRNIGCKLAEFLSGTSRKYHTHIEKNLNIEKDIIEYARIQWSKNIDTVLIGHYHQTGIVSENEKRLIWMGDWLNLFTVTKLDNNGWSQFKWL